MNYINGIELGGGWNSDGLFRRQLKRMLWLWLNKVVGWADIDKSGSNWDNAEIAGASDGVTHASDSEIFTSATGGFSGLSYPSDQKYFLTVTGFADSAKNGLYPIDQVVSDNEIKIRKAFSGVHSDGFPLNEAGLTWRVDELGDPGNKPPGSSDWWVLGGTGTGGIFHLRCLCNGTYYSPQYDISPYSDWDAVGHIWNTTRKTRIVGGSYSHRDQDRGYVFGVADLTHVALWIYGYDYNWGTVLAAFYYFGDIVPFRPTNDPRPVIAIAHQLFDEYEFANFNNYSDSRIGMLDANDNESNYAGFMYLTEYGSSASRVLDNFYKQRSSHSGKYYRLPIIIQTKETGKEEIRGYLKSFNETHTNGLIKGVPFGTGLDQLCLGQASMVWNGSKQYRIF